MVENFFFFFVYTFRRIYTKGTRKLTAAPLSWQVHAEASRNSAPELSLESARFGVNRSHVCRPPRRLQPTVSGQKQRRGGFCLSAVSRRTNNTASHAAPHARPPLCPTSPDSAHARTEPRQVSFHFLTPLFAPQTAHPDKLTRIPQLLLTSSSSSSLKLR